MCNSNTMHSPYINTSSNCAKFVVLTWTIINCAVAGNFTPPYSTAYPTASFLSLQYPFVLCQITLLPIYQHNYIYVFIIMHCISIVSASRFDLAYPAISAPKCISRTSYYARQILQTQYIRRRILFEDRRICFPMTKSILETINICSAVFKLAHTFIESAMNSDVCHYLRGSSPGSTLTQTC